MELWASEERESSLVLFCLGWMGYVGKQMGPFPKGSASLQKTILDNIEHPPASISCIVFQL